MMSAQPSPKVCVVFGYGPGMGASCARRWIKGGFKVAIVARDPDKLLAFEIKFGPSVAKGYPCDVTNRQQMERTISQIEVDLGPIHTIVYNAGRGVFKKYTEVTEDDFERCVNVNAKGLLMAAQLICPKMEKRGEGVVAITGAIAALRGKPFTPAFAAGKAAQRMVAQSLARDLGPKNIHVFYVIIDGGVDQNEEIGQQRPGMLDPNAVADTYWNLAQQPKNCWGFEIDIRPNVEKW